MLKVVDDITYLYLDIDILLSDLRRGSTRTARKLQVDGVVDDRIVFKSELNSIAFDILSDFMIEADKTMSDFSNGTYISCESVDWNEGKVYAWEVNTDCNWRTPLEKISNNLDLFAKAFLLWKWLSDSVQLDYSAEMGNSNKQERVFKLSLYNAIRSIVDVYED